MEPWLFVVAVTAPIVITEIIHSRLELRKSRKAVWMVSQTAAVVLAAQLERQAIEDGSELKSLSEIFPDLKEEDLMWLQAYGGWGRFPLYPKEVK